MTLLRSPSPSSYVVVQYTDLSFIQLTPQLLMTLFLNNQHLLILIKSCPFLFSLLLSALYSFITGSRSFLLNHILFHFFLGPSFHGKHFKIFIAKNTPPTLEQCLTRAQNCWLVVFPLSALKIKFSWSIISSVNDFEQSDGFESHQ